MRAAVLPVPQIVEYARARKAGGGGSPELQKQLDEATSEVRQAHQGSEVRVCASI